ncbi:cell division protein FtsL [uncultured Oxalicibacterium sp.]|uniref:cell division protein FtsL n=1 Tax=uncultured Oxalicibacterium sp. TaxID=1168540 RepID=UPI0025ED2219|nr:cell division protein FtsL [uncultured Oxalicibacterium sp.]
MSGRITFVLTAVLVLCALSVVNAHYQSRSLFIALEREQAKARQLEIDWTQLQLDQSTLGVHGRIEANARRDLRMVPASPASTQYLNLGAK